MSAPPRRRRDRHFAPPVDRDYGPPRLRELLALVPCGLAGFLGALVAIVLALLLPGGGV